MSSCLPETTNSPGAQHVLDAARALFAEQGVDAVSIQDIANKAGVSKANVFHHFANKEALYIAVIRACIKYDKSNVATLIASKAPFEQRFLALLRSQLKEMLDDPSGTRLVIREVTNGNVERAKLIATEIFSSKVQDRIGFFEDAMARGELRADVQPYFCDMLLGACCMFHFNCGEASKTISKELGFDTPPSTDDFARAMSQMLTQGICAQPAPLAGNAKPKTPRAVAAPPKITRRTKSL